MNKALTQSKIHSLFEYREDGNLLWKVSSTNRVRIGDIVGYLNIAGYHRVQIDRKKYFLHRLIYMYHHGSLTPGMDIDHIDGNKSNNRIENLREITHSQNLMNAKINKNSKTGVKGVYFSKKAKKYQTQLVINGKNTYLGTYSTLEEAEKVMKEAREKYHGEYARHE